MENRLEMLAKLLSGLNVIAVELYYQVSKKLLGLTTYKYPQLTTGTVSYRYRDNE